MITLTSTVSGEYRLVVKRGGEEVQDSGWFKNLILDAGLDRIGSQQTCATFAQVGTGTTAPANAQTALTAFLASSFTTGSTTNTNEGSPNYRATLTIPFVFNQGAVVGNITEVGVGWESSSGGLFSRALIVDGGGTPTTLTLTAVDQLTVYYRLRVAPPLADGTGSVTLASIVYNYTMRLAFASQFADRVNLLNTIQTLAYPYNVAAYDSTSTLGAVTDGPSGVSSNGLLTANAYVNGNFYRDYVATFSITQGNHAGGTKGMLFSWGALGCLNFQCVFSAAIPKDNTKVLTFNIRHGWARG